MAAVSDIGIECLVAVTGLYPSEPVSSGDVKEAQKIPKETASIVRAFFDSDEPTKVEKAAPVSYLATWRRFHQRQNDAKISILIAEPEVRSAYVAKLNEVRSYLKGQWRPTAIKTILGQKLLPPSISEEARCRDLYAMGNDVRRIVRRLTSSLMMSEEIALVRAVFPEFYAMVGLYIDAEMHRRSSLRKSWEVPYRQEVAIRAFVGDSDVSAETINAESLPPEQAAPPEFEIATKRNRTDALTRADRVEDSTPA